MAIRNVTDDDFQSAMDESKHPVFIKFGAEWCPPCQAMSPLLAELAQQYADKMTFLEVDVDTGSAIADRYDIRGIPAYLICRDGEVVAREHSEQSRQHMVQFIETSLGGETP